MWVAWKSSGDSRQYASRLPPSSVRAADEVAARRGQPAQEHRRVAGLRHAGVAVFHSRCSIRGGDPTRSIPTSSTRRDGRACPPPADLAATVRWLSTNTFKLNDLQDAALVRKALDKLLLRTTDGKPA